jgi:hypothetical protein
MDTEFYMAITVKKHNGKKLDKLKTFLDSDIDLFVHKTIYVFTISPSLITP